MDEHDVGPKQNCFGGADFGEERIFLKKYIYLSGLFKYLSVRHIVSRRNREI
jgi:hypothetical protein